MVEILPEILAVAVALIAILAEAVHLRRIRKIRYLAFGPKGKPAPWVILAPLLRVVSLAAATWGFASLLFVVEAEVHNQSTLEEKDYKHLVLVVDVSPSMRLKDAGPDGERTRRERASDVLESMFSRIPMRQFKISVVAVYTEAKMLLEDSSDHEVVRFIMERMPLYHAFKPGKTNLLSGIEQAFQIAKSWNPDSTFVVVLTDGDTIPAKGMPKLPASVAELIVVGVGNSNSGTFIDGHMSRQDINTLRQLANRLRGVYHNGDQKHLTAAIVNNLTKVNEDDQSTPWGRREWSLFAAIAGSSIFAIIPLLLHYFGTRYKSGAPINNA
ncbi:MAG: VWA domain-containing protein [Planctomycetaceae bacterium]|nr:VWA domain-containing protein [Planctomycetaceae bacterium]